MLDNHLLFDSLAAISWLGFLLVSAWLWSGSKRNKPEGPPQIWWMPLLLLAVFFAWSLYTLWQEGLFGFWVEHTDSHWGIQVWMDLLLAFGIGWFLILPRAIAVGMRPVPWLCFIFCTGCIGFLSMLSRLLYLEAQSNAVQTPLVDS